MVLHFTAAHARRALASAVLLAGLFHGMSAACAAGGKPAVDRQTLVVVLSSEPGNLDPQVAPSVDSAKFAWNVFDTLYGFDRTGQLVPRLATAYKQSDDGLTWTFTLRSGVTFQNGDPFTAKDVKYSLERVLDPATRSTRRPYFINTVESVSAPDDRTVVFRLARRDGAFLNKIAGYLYIVPQKYTQSLPNPEAFALAPVGTGPYRVASRTVGQSLVLQRYDGFWGARPAIATIRYRFIGEPASRVNAVVNGEADVAAEVSANDAERLRADNQVSVISVPGGSPLHVRIYSNDPKTPLSKRDVRLALNYAIDRDAIIKSVFRGAAAPLASTIPSSYPYGSNPDLKPFPYDPAKARQLLAQAGYPKGFDTSLYCAAAFPRTLCEAVAAYWSQIGVRAQVKVIDYVAFNRINNVHQSGPLAFSEFGNAIYDPIHVIGGSVSKTGTWSDYSNPQVQALIDQVEGESDRSKRDALFRQILALTRDDGQAVLIAELKLNYVQDPSLNWQPQSAGWNLDFRSATWK
ncbi:ABC transporter substrate-binding protein [Caballeronia sp. LZ034LL]|uniref:ABC transporter substrate-binding protein n=1 Tax=Caballeronia sp. LZ034LL TaxID=3038567 RepID=UPI0028642113|nr:ABC transporter substrate-binding protein [Caballeronia sp. LZ034LL]MDR5836022.1 ABC transporter substrate-binding protein [Caballeronia sp. LZ034LL]